MDLWAALFWPSILVASAGLILYLICNLSSFSSPWNSLNSLWPSDGIWWHRSGPTLTQVMAWCLTAPSHYLNRCWLLICEVLCLSCKSNFTRKMTSLDWDSPWVSLFWKSTPIFKCDTLAQLKWQGIYRHNGISNVCESEMAHSSTRKS